jgi:hypothetical protein
MAINNIVNWWALDDVVSVGWWESRPARYGARSWEARFRISGYHCVLPIIIFL